MNAPDPNTLVRHPDNVRAFIFFDSPSGGYTETFYPDLIDLFGINKISIVVDYHDTSYTMYIADNKTGDVRFIKSNVAYPGGWTPSAQ
ncbi:MAG: hypothetical protein ACRD1R_11525 [Acidobacteriota bacterium]